jgi:hypothetical protein
MCKRIKFNQYFYIIIKNYKIWVHALIFSVYRQINNISITCIKHLILNIYFLIFIAILINIVRKD